MSEEIKSTLDKQVARGNIRPAREKVTWIGKGTITGFVKSTIGRAISGADVSGAGVSRITDNLGKYTIDNVLPGTYTVSAQAAGCISQSRSVVVAGDTKTVDFTLVEEFPPCPGADPECTGPSPSYPCHGPSPSYPCHGASPE